MPGRFLIDARLESYFSVSIRSNHQLPNRHIERKDERDAKRRGAVTTYVIEHRNETETSEQLAKKVHKILQHSKQCREIPRDLQGTHCLLQNELHRAILE